MKLKILLAVIAITICIPIVAQEKESNTWIREIGTLKPLREVSGSTSAWILKPQGEKSLELRGDFNMLRPLEEKRVEIIGRITERVYSETGTPQLVRVTYAYELEDSEKDLTVQGKIKLPESLVKEKDKVLCGFVITGDVSPIPFYKENFLQKPNAKELMGKLRGRGKGTQAKLAENELPFKIPLFVRKGVNQAQYRLVAWIDKNDDFQMDARDTQADTQKLTYTYRNGKWTRKSGSKEEELTSPLKDIVIEFKGK